MESILGIIFSLLLLSVANPSFAMKRGREECTDLDDQRSSAIIRCDTFQILTLPEEIIGLIIRVAPMRKNYQLSQTNKFFNQFYWQCLHTIDLPFKCRPMQKYDFGQRLDHTNNLASCINLQSLTLTDMPNPNSWIPALYHLNQLKTLSLDVNETLEKDEGLIFMNLLAPALPTLTGLKSITLSLKILSADDVAEMLANSNLKLKHISLDRCETGNNSKSLTCLNKLTNLRRLKLDYEKQMPACKFNDICTLTNLRGLNVSGLFIAEQNIMSTITSLVNLKFLTLQHVENMHQMELKYLAELPKLVYLELEDCRDFDASVAQAMKRCTNLVVLKMRELHSNDKLLQSSCHDKLKVLWLSAISGLSKDFATLLKKSHQEISIIE